MSCELTTEKGGRRLRCGYTTGSCAALAAQAAAHMLLFGQPMSTASIITPSGVALSVVVEDAFCDGITARCAVRKDAGDDIDVTQDMRIYAELSRCARPGVHIEGGEGIGRVTRPGLDQPVGAAAINRVPRRMITEAVESVCQKAGYTGGLRVVISAPGGREVALKTFNPQLGIEGGISILGTTGIVEPMSLKALVDTIGVEMDMHAAEGATRLVLTPGNMGERFLAEQSVIRRLPHVKCSNFIGESIDMALYRGFHTLLLVGHIGKLVKVAGGVMDTHSRIADCRAEILTAHAALAGAEQDCLEAVMESATTDAALDILENAGLLNPVIDSLLDKIQHHLSRRAGPDAQIGALVFSNERGALGMTHNARQILAHLEETDD